MTTAFMIRSLIEFAAIMLLIFGYIHEEKVIAFEQAVKRIVIGNIRRYIRIKNHKKAVARGEHLHLHTTHGKANSSESVVA